MPKFKILLARFPYGGREESECVDWLIDVCGEIRADPRFELYRGRINDTPITMTRNAALVGAVESGMDFVMMVDSDMAPDCELGVDPAAKPFWPTTIEFMLDHKGPCVVGAPYCGPPPHENVYVFQWADRETDSPNSDGRIEQFTREQAAVMAGIQETAALPTGLIIFDTRAFKGHPHPWTYYEYEGDGSPCEKCGVRTPGPQAKKGSTEDVTLTRDLSLAGVPQYCNWDAWAGHVKRKVVRKPRLLKADAVATRMHQAIVSRRREGESLVEAKGSRFADDIRTAEEAAREQREAPLGRRLDGQPWYPEGMIPQTRTVDIHPVDLFHPGPFPPPAG